MSYVRVPSAPASVARVRKLLRRDLASLPAETREEAAIVASELVCNAVRHGSGLEDGKVAVQWAIGERGVEITVTDGGGPSVPAMRVAPPTATWGRGLSIVAQLTSGWGVDRVAGRTTVWAVIPVPEQRRANA